MAHIVVTKGLDIPIKGHPTGKVRPNQPAGEAKVLQKPKQIALMFEPFKDLKLKVLAKPGESVKIGQPLAEDKAVPGRMFLSPAAGVIAREQRGLKRVLEALVIDVADREEHFERKPLSLAGTSKESLTDYMLEIGAFTFLRKRPFNQPAHPAQTPRAIFVKALESAPFTPPSEMQIAHHEEDFALGLEALTKFCPGNVHLVYRHGSNFKAFSGAKGVQLHTAEGPHPVANSSVHIQQIAPIQGYSDIIWTITALEVARIGHLIRTGKDIPEKVIAIAGPGIIEDQAGYYKVRYGVPINALTEGRIAKGQHRMVSGDPLMGRQVGIDDFMGYYDTVFCVIPENTKRQMLHFFRIGLDKYSFSRAYISGHLDPHDREYPFTTNQHGEHRAFIDASLYDKVMPLNVPVMHLVKAVMAQDYELAEELGLLEVDAEDFALPTFVCPSKQEMVQTIRQGLKQYASSV